MKFNLKVAHRDDSTEKHWVEDYNRSEIRNEDQAREYGRRLIENFNDTLRPGERPRQLLDVTFEDNEAIANHDWYKRNAVTLIDPRRGSYDAMQCTICGVTGKRYGLVTIKIDGRFRAKRYKTCNS
jgi:hypothetical protein